MIATTRELDVLNQASRMLDEAKSLEEIKSIRDKAEAARNYVKAAKLGLDLQNFAAEVKLRAERKAGSLLRSLKLRGGDRKSKLHAGPLKLADLGISRNQSKRWQHIASVSDGEFVRYLKHMTDRGAKLHPPASCGSRPKSNRRRGTDYLLRKARAPAQLRNVPPRKCWTSW